MSFMTINYFIKKINVLFVEFIDFTMVTHYTNIFFFSFVVGFVKTVAVEREKSDIGNEYSEVTEQTEDETNIDGNKDHEILMEKCMFYKYL